jgi:hypothetical protein
MFRIGIVTSKGRIESKDFSTREEVDNYFFDMDEKEKVVNYRIKENGILIETEKGVR